MERLPGFRDFYPEPLPHPDVWSADARQHLRCMANRPPENTASVNTTDHRWSRWNCSPRRAVKKSLGNSTISGQGRACRALRPEMTPTLARMVAAHERNYKKADQVVRDSATVPLRAPAERKAAGTLSVQRRHHWRNVTGGRDGTDCVAHRFCCARSASRTRIS